jgi:hypothetical protein
VRFTFGAFRNKVTYSFERKLSNFNIPCEVLLTILVTSERKDKENSVHVCGNGEKGLGYEYWKHGIKCEERDELLCTGGDCTP